MSGEPMNVDSPKDINGASDFRASLENSFEDIDMHDKDAFWANLTNVNTHIALFVTGGIAVYKACEVLRDLQKAGCEVRVCMSSSATKMVGVQTFEALSGNHVMLDLFDDAQSAIPHIELAEWADVALVCPATANIIAKMAHGLADDAPSATLLACSCPVVVAPAMNVNMWNNPATQANVATLKDRGFFFAGPVEGHLACGTEGVGKLADVHAISDVVLGVAEAFLFTSIDNFMDEDYDNSMQDIYFDDTLVQYVPQDLSGKKLLITAGPTHEVIDPVRYIANNSTGKMGYAIATAAAIHGAEVVLVAGPTQLADPLGVTTIHVTSAQEMFEACVEEFENADGAILSAAVCDYRPKCASDHKLKKGKEQLDVLELEETSDILATLSASAHESAKVIFGFAAETNDVIANAQAKLARKDCDMIIANDVSCAESTFGSDTNRVSFVYEDEVHELPLLTKRQLADYIVEEFAMCTSEYDYDATEDEIGQ